MRGARCPVPADVHIEPAAIDEVLAVLETAGTLERLAEADPARPRGRSYADARIDRVVLTPDVHKGAGIPLPRTFISGP